MGILAFDVPFGRQWLLSHGIRIAVVVVGALVLLTLSRLAVGRMQRRLEAVKGDREELDVQRAATITQAISYVVRVGVWTVTVLLLLGEFGISIGPLLAGAGIAGVALGFGAQSIVRDFLSGFFFLLEDQFAVGDLVTLNAAGKEIQGRVEGLSLRITQVRDEAGTVHVIPNGNIAVVGNRSRPGAGPGARRRSAPPLVP